MNDQFSSKEELFQRVIPALRARKMELNRIGFIDIDEEIIWDYLVNKKWKNGHGLMLSDIVNDIMKVDYYEIKYYQEYR